MWHNKILQFHSFAYTCPVFQKLFIERVARRDKKALLSDQCKEIEQNHRMGKTSDLFKKIRDIKETFHTKMAQYRTKESGLNRNREV